MPLNKANYPDDWDRISLQVREEAKQRCEICAAPNGKVIRRDRDTWHITTAVMELDVWVSTAGLSWRRLRFHGLTKVILTVAHMDRDTTNNERSNLKALCQRCHLNHDRAAQHVPKRKFGSNYDGKQQFNLF